MRNRRPPAARRPPAPAALALVALLAVLAAAPPAPAQEAPPALTIDEPGADAYLVDRVQLRATVTGVVDVAAVAFFVDGAPACEAPAPGFTCAWDAGPRVRARVVRAVARLPDGGRLVHSVRTRDRPATFFTAETSVLLVPVVVRDRRGRFVDGLTQDDFAIFENGVPQEIRFFETRGVPLDLVLAVDFSSSVAPVAGALRRAARRFVGALAGSGSLSVIAFNDRPFVLARRERDADKLLAAIDRLPRPIGGTAMLDAISRALTLHGEDLAHQVVVLFTDGDDQHSLSSLQGVEERIRTSQATVYVVTLGEGRRIERVRTLLERLTSVSGGRSFPIERIADVERALDTVRSDLRERYFLGYRPTNADLDGTWRQIEVRTPDRRHVIRAREGYLASPSLGGAAGARPYRQPPPGRARPLPAAARRTGRRRRPRRRPLEA